MAYIDPHIHMVSRTTDDYRAMAQAGCVAITEPAFWAGFDRSSPAGFFDYFRQLTEVEPKRAAQYGIAHHCWLCINPKEADLEIRAEKMSRSLTIIYALQSSLDFEQGGEIAENLFRLYEYAREQILIDHKSGEAVGVKVAISSLEEIREAWVEIRSIL